MIRAFKRWASVFTLAATALGASAQPAPYPSKPVRLVVPFAAGGPIDVLARALAVRLAATTGQQFIVDNKPGAGSIIAWDHVAKSPADGYTLLVAGIGTRTILPSIASQVPFDPAKDLVAISRLSDAANIFVAHPGSGFKSLADVVTKAKVQPDKVSIANPAPGTVTHFAASLLQRDAGIKLSEIPYKGGAPAALAVAAGEVDLMTADIGAVLPQIQGGRIVPLAVGAPQRLAMLPQVPTAIEAGYPNLVAVNVYGLFGPANLPKDVVTRINALATEAMRAPDVIAQVAKIGMVPETSTPEAFEAYLREQTAKWAPVAKASGVRFN